MKTFEIERIEVIEVIPEGASNAPGLWQIRPTSRPA
jgi:hypothetical protein